MDGVQGGEVGSELTISLTFKSNPKPDEIKWFMHDLDKPLIVPNVTYLKNNDEMNISETRYRWGELTEVLIIKKITKYYFHIIMITEWS